MNPRSALRHCWSKRFFEKIVEINKQQGISILLVEQNANLGWK